MQLLIHEIGLYIFARRNNELVYMITKRKQASRFPESTISRHIQ